MEAKRTDQVMPPAPLSPWRVVFKLSSEPETREIEISIDFFDAIPCEGMAIRLVRAESQVCTDFIVVSCDVRPEERTVKIQLSPFDTENDGQRPG